MRSAKLGWLVLAVAGLAIFPVALDGQARRLSKIPVFKHKGESLPGAPLLPTPAECQEAVRRIAAAYAPDSVDELAPLLARDFPNRSEFLDALRRADLRVSRLELRVESVERTLIQPWTHDEGPNVWSADCIADVRTRLIYDDPATGKRTVSDPDRAEWQIRFYARSKGERP